MSNDEATQVLNVPALPARGFLFGDCRLDVRVILPALLGGWNGVSLGKTDAANSTRGGIGRSSRRLRVMS
jgi:hypothetical protein